MVDVSGYKELYWRSWLQNAGQTLQDLKTYCRKNLLSKVVTLEDNVQEFGWLPKSFHRFMGHFLSWKKRPPARWQWNIKPVRFDLLWHGGQTSRHCPCDWSWAGWNTARQPHVFAEMVRWIMGLDPNSIQPGGLDLAFFSVFTYGVPRTDRASPFLEPQWFAGHLEKHCHGKHRSPQDLWEI